MQILLIIGVLTLLDTTIGSVKTRLVVDGDALKSTVLNTAAYLIYLAGLIFLVEYAGPLKYVAAGTAKALGTYLGVVISTHYQKDEIWLVQVLTPSVADGELFIENLQKSNIKFFVTNALNHNLLPTYSIDITCPNKESTKEIQEIAPVGSVFVNKVSRGIVKKSKSGAYRELWLKEDVKKQTV